MLLWNGLETARGVRDTNPSRTCFITPLISSSSSLPSPVSHSADSSSDFFLPKRNRCRWFGTSARRDRQFNIPERDPPETSGVTIAIRWWSGGKVNVARTLWVGNERVGVSESAGWIEGFRNPHHTRKMEGKKEVRKGGKRKGRKHGACSP
jgi:hypothetical protein